MAERPGRDTLNAPGAAHRGGRAAHVTATDRAVELVTLAATAVLFVRIPKGFVPDSDNDQLLIQTEAEQGISFEQMARNQQKVADMVRKDPAVLAFFS